MGCSASVPPPPPPPPPPIPEPKISAPTAYDILISHRRADGSSCRDALTDRMHKGLEEAGYSVWLDDSNSTGDSLKAMEPCKVFIPLISPAVYESLEPAPESLESAPPQPSLALKELEQAVALHKQIVAVHHSGPWPPPSMAILLSDLDHVPKKRCLDESDDLDADVEELLQAIYGLGVKPQQATQWAKDQEERVHREQEDAKLKAEKAARLKLEEEERLAKDLRQEQERIKALVASVPVAAFLDGCGLTSLIEPICSSLHIFEAIELAGLTDEEIEMVHATKEQMSIINAALQDQPIRMRSEIDKRMMYGMDLQQLLDSSGLSRHAPWLRDELHITKTPDLVRLRNDVDSIPGITRFEKKRLLDLIQDIADGAAQLDEESRQRVMEEHRIRQEMMRKQEEEDRLSKLLVSGGRDGLVRIWNLGKPECKATLKGHAGEVNSVAISTDSKVILSGSLDKTVRVWDWDGSQCKCTAILEGHSNSVTSVAISQDGGTAASSSWDQTVRVWDVARQTCLFVLQGHTREVNCVAISPDGCSVASSSSDGTVRVFGIHSGQCMSVIEGHTRDVTSLAFSPTCSDLATGSFDKSIRIWDVSTAECKHNMQGHTGWVTSVAFCPEGKRLISGSFDHTAIVWDLETGKVRLKLQGHQLFVSSVAISRDAKFAVTASGDKTIRMWDMRSGGCKAVVKGHSDFVYGVAMVPRRAGPPGP